MALSRNTILGARDGGEKAAMAAKENARAALNDAQEAIHHGAEALRQKGHELEAGLRERAATASSVVKEQAAHLSDSASRAYQSSLVRLPSLPVSCVYVWKSSNAARRLILWVLRACTVVEPA